MGDGYGTIVNLPPGFRFYPTDEELVVHFLHRKASLLPCHPDIIPDLDLYTYDPWELHGKAMEEGNQWYFYSRKTQNRVTKNGYWRPTGTEEAIFSGNIRKKVGTKKNLCFYLGEAPAGGVKTNWFMQEYSLPDSPSSSSGRSSKRGGRGSGSGIHKTDCSKWVICRVYEQNYNGEEDDGTELSCLDEVFLSLDDLDEVSLP